MTMDIEAPALELKPGDRVQVDEDLDDFCAGVQGTVTAVKDDPDGGKLVTIREVDPAPNYFTVPAGALKLDTSPEWLDFDQLEHVVQELRDIAGSSGKYCSLDSAERGERLFALARIITLAGRASHLEICAERKEKRETEAGGEDGILTAGPPCPSLDSDADLGRA